MAKKQSPKSSLTFLEGGVMLSGGLNPEVLAEILAESKAQAGRREPSPEQRSEELIAELAQLMLSGRRSGSAPYTLLLGAGASVGSGARLTSHVIEDVVGGYDVQQFDKYLSLRSDEERFARLRGAIEGMVPSSGYHSLAKLTRAGFFEVILTTNFDPLVEDAFAGEGLKRRDVSLLINGVMEPEYIEEQLACREPRVKVLKLHGDLFYRKLLFTGEEIRKYPTPLRRALDGPLNTRGVLVVGHALVDPNLGACIRKSGHKIWRINPGPLKPEAEKVLRTRESLPLCIGGEMGRFDAFFDRLAASLLATATTAPVDELRRAIVAVKHPGTGDPVGTGFLLRGSGLVVTDAMVAGGLAGAFRLSTGGRALAGNWKASGGRRARGPFARKGTTGVMQPFGAGIEQRMELVIEPTSILDYAVFKAEDSLWKDRGFDLTNRVPPPGTRVTTGIAVGQSMGFRDGVLQQVNFSTPVQGPDGEFQASGLMVTDIPIDNGACGAPLLGEDGLCCGMMVAGAEGGPSMALPATHLIDKIQPPRRQRSVVIGSRKKSTKPRR